MQQTINGVRRIDYDIEDEDDLLVDVFVIAAEDRTVLAGADVTVTPERCRVWRTLSDNEINARYWHLVGAE